MDFYCLLGIPIDADEETIRGAYRSLARRYHPDAGEGSSIEKFRQVTQAYETLSNPGRRRIYDLGLHRVRPRNVPVEPIGAHPGRFAQPVSGMPFDGSLPRAVFPPLFHVEAVIEALMESLDDDDGFWSAQWPW